MPSPVDPAVLSALLDEFAMQSDEPRECLEQVIEHALYWFGADVARSLFADLLAAGAVAPKAVAA